MRFASIAVHNLGPFTDVALDLSAVQGPIVAVTGENGAGKSTLLELLAAAIYRTTPTRGKLSDLATGRDSYVEAKVVNGAAYTIRHSVDGASRKGESLVLDDTGAPVLPSGKVAEFDRWAAEHLPSPEVFFSSTFSAQGSGGFLEAKPGDRKAILLRALGIERLEGLAEKAREHEREARQAVAVVQARLDDERSRGLDVEEAERTLALAVYVAAQADADLKAAKVELERVEGEAREAVEARKASAVYFAERARLDAKRTALVERIDDLGRRIANNRMVLGDADSIREAVVELERLRGELESLRSKHGDAERDHKTWLHASIDWRQRGNDAGMRAASARARIAAVQKRLDDTAAIEAAVADLERLRDAVGVAAAKRLEVKESYEALLGQRAAGTEERIGHLREGLGRVSYADDWGHARQIAAHTLLDDDDEVALAKDLPGKITSARCADIDAVAALERERKALDACERLASRAPDLDMAHQDLAAARRDLEAAEADRDAANARHEDANKRADESEKERKRLHFAARELESRFGVVERLALRATHLDTAEARIEELAPQLDAATAEVVEIGRVIAMLGEPPAVLPPPDVEALVLAVRQAERAARDAHAAPPVREHALQQAKESAERAAQLEQDRAVMEAELADWVKLAADLGRNGLQAYEVDAVGAELTALANDYLHACFGTRWTLSIETQRNSADGKKVIEGCEVQVLDTERGREALAESLSGGEKVIISEAISLALMTVACRRAGVDRPSIVRDETGAALDAQRGAQYVQMLRRASQTIGAEHVLFVAHNPDLWELADARIHVANGKVRVEA
jgi:exonuclease SbcC